MSKPVRVRTIPLTTEPDPMGALFGVSDFIQIPCRVAAVVCDGVELQPAKRDVMPGDRIRVALPLSATERAVVTFSIDVERRGRMLMPGKVERAVRLVKRTVSGAFGGRPGLLDLEWRPDFSGRVVGIKSKLTPACLTCGGTGELGIEERVECPTCEPDARTASKGHVFSRRELRVGALMFVGVDLQMMTAEPVPLEVLNGHVLQTSSFMPAVCVTLNVTNASPVPCDLEVELLVEEDDAEDSKTSSAHAVS